MSTKETIVKVSPSSLIPNQTKLDIYDVPANYDEIKKNIEEHGIIEPLLVDRKTNILISGNLRLQIAIELGLTEVPVIFRDIEKKDLAVKSISTNQQRQKTYFEILKEIEFFEQHYKIKKGQRTDLKPEMKELKEKRDAFLRSYSRTTREKVKAIASLAAEIHGKDSENFKGVFKSLDNGKTTLNGLYQHLLDVKQRKQNAKVIPAKFEILRDNTKIFNHSSEDMHEVDDESVHAIITSPPYFQMRDYGNAEDELGQEQEVELYLLNLMKIFKECYRVLRKDGNIFVNINDCVLGGQYQAVPHLFVYEMRKLGWILNDEILWIKNNPTYTRGKRSVRSHEPIFHFVKSSEFYYDDSWLRNIEDEEDKVSYGITKSSPKLKSGMDYRDGVLETNVSSTRELREKCKDEGFHLTHSATFPLRVPEICGLLSTREGDTILDCFAGTSTVGRFALENRRKFIGFELNPEFIKASEINLRGFQFYKRFQKNEGKFETTENFLATLNNLNSSNFTFKSTYDLGLKEVKPIASDIQKDFKKFTRTFNRYYRKAHKKK